MKVRVLKIFVYDQANIKNVDTQPYKKISCEAEVQNFQRISSLVKIKCKDKIFI